MFLMLAILLEVALAAVEDPIKSQTVLGAAKAKNDMPDVVCRALTELFLHHNNKYYETMICRKINFSTCQLAEYIFQNPKTTIVIHYSALKDKNGIDCNLHLMFSSKYCTKQMNRNPFKIRMEI